MNSFTGGNSSHTRSFFSQLKNIYQLSDIAQHNRSLWGITFSNFLGGIASVMVFSILPIFMKEELNLSFSSVGIIEGIAIGCAFLAKILSGILSDSLKKRKPLIVIGCIGSLLIKPIFAITSSMAGVFVAKSVDRFAKGIRAAPTDALIADLSGGQTQGKTFGTRYAFYATGFVIGGLISSYIMMRSNNNFRLVFWLSLIPATLSLIVLLRYVRDAAMDALPSSPRIVTKWRFDDLSQLPPEFWKLMIVIFFLMTARFSDSFLLFRGREVGYSIASIPLMMIFYNILEAAASVPVGKLADKWNKNILFLAGICVLFVANIMIIMFSFHASIILSICLAGLHMGMTQGLMGTLIAVLTPAHLRGTAFAIFYCVAGIAVPIGNLAAGYCGDLTAQHGLGIIGAFTWGAITTFCAAIALTVIIIKKSQS